MQDGRRKLDPTLHPEIIRKYKTGLYSWNSLGKEYGVSKRLIGLIVNPAAKKREQQRNKERWHDYYIHYGKEAHRIAMKKMRDKKRTLGLVYNRQHPERPVKSREQSD